LLADDTVQRVPLLYMQNSMRNPYAAHVDFRDFVGLIPDNPLFLPSNVDMMAERHGYFFIGEWKKPNEGVSKGQQLLLQALARTPKFTVLLINGTTDGPQTWVGDSFRLDENLEGTKVASNLKELQAYYQNWYKNIR